MLDISYVFILVACPDHWWVFPFFSKRQTSEEREEMYNWHLNEMRLGRDQYGTPPFVDLSRASLSRVELSQNRRDSPWNILMFMFSNLEASPSKIVSFGKLKWKATVKALSNKPAWVNNATLSWGDNWGPETERKKEKKEKGKGKSKDCHGNGTTPIRESEQRATCLTYQTYCTSWICVHFNELQPGENQ